MLVDLLKSWVVMEEFVREQIAFDRRVAYSFSATRPREVLTPRNSYLNPPFTSLNRKLTMKRARKDSQTPAVIIKRIRENEPFYKERDRYVASL